MRPSSTAARWTWGHEHDRDSDTHACLLDLATAHTVLTKHRLMTGAPHLSVTLHQAGSNKPLLHETFEPAGNHLTSSDIETLLRRLMTATTEPEHIGGIDIDITSHGEILNSQPHTEPNLCRLGASAQLGYVSVELATHSDAWLPYDLKGRPQPSTHAANGPRLAATLRDLAQALNTETDPDDPTWFAKPHETGADNITDDTNGTPLDVWTTYELPYRYERLTHTPTSGHLTYRRHAESNVQCTPILGKHGLLGHLWASDEDNAAGFEPQDIADDEQYQAALTWLNRLDTAHNRGLTPSHALTELSSLPDDDTAGHADPRRKPRTLPLATLRQPLPN